METIYLFFADMEEEYGIVEVEVPYSFLEDRDGLLDLNEWEALERYEECHDEEIYHTIDRSLRAWCDWAFEPRTHNVTRRYRW